MSNHEADVIIVGAGVAGLHIAHELSRAGLSVLVLESGPRVNRVEAVARYRSAVAKVPTSPYEEVEHAPRPSVIALEDYYIQEGPVFFKSDYERQVGGTTWHWLGTCLRHLPADFELQTRYGQGMDWALSYDDLEGWYWAAENSMGVAGHTGVDLGSPREHPEYAMLGLPMTYLDKQVQIAARSLGLDVLPTPQARNSIAYDERPPCCGSASCVPICPIAAKYDASVHATKAEKLGTRIIENAVAHFIEVGDDEKITQVRFKRPDGSEESATGRIFIIAANAIETPKLLLMSRTDSRANGVANSSDMVGRNLMDHPVQLSWALAQNPVFPYRSPLENAGIENFRDGAFRSERAAFRMAIGEDGWSFPGTTPTSLAEEFINQGLLGSELRDAINNHVARQFRFASLIEQLPDPENRIVPAFDQLDAIGIPRPRIHYNLSSYITDAMAEARRVAEDIFNAMNCTDIQHSEEHFGAGHVMGTYRMGDNPADSVVDNYQRTHDHPNLFLVGSGTFPTVGTANPTLTLVALALRSADFIEQNFQTI
jgi:glucose dehydrogenase